MTVQLKDGRTVDASEIDFADDSTAYLMSAVGRIENITPKAATAIIGDYDPSSGQTVGEYLNGVDEAFTYGYYGYSEADLNAGDFTGKLTDVQKKSAYVMGREARKHTDSRKVERQKKMRTAAEKINTDRDNASQKEKRAEEKKQPVVTYNAGNGKIVELEKAGVKLSAKQSGAVHVAKILHRLGLGTRFEFFSSYLSKTLKDKNGNPARVFLDAKGKERIAYSGLYRMSDGTIRIDLNAYNGKGLTLNAMAHELTHFIQQWSVDKYKALADFLIKTYEKTDMTMHQRVLREQKRLENIRGEKISYDEAFDEVVANAMSKMLDDGKIVEKLTKLRERDKQLAQKLWDGFKKILAKFTDIYKQQSALFHDTADLMEMKDAFEHLQELFAEALVEASDHYRTADITKNPTKGGGVRYSVEETFYNEFDAWDKKNTNLSFIVGTTSTPLLSIGMKEQNIILRSGTVLQKIKDHPEMTFDIFKGIPALLEHPVIVQFSDAINPNTERPKYDSSITVLGELYAEVKENGEVVKKPVLVSLELLPTNQKKTAVLDFAIIKSAYSKNALQQYLNENSILYIDPNKKRTDNWLSLNRLQLPLGENHYGSIRKISYADGKVKVQNSKSMTEMQRKLLAAGAIDEFGNNRLSGHETDDISNRDLLANAFEGITKDSVEYEKIQEYKRHIQDLNALEKNLSKLNAQIREIRFTKGKYDARKLAELESKAKIVAGEINRHDKKLLSLEASEPLRKVIERERRKEAQRTREHIKEIQQNKKAKAEQTELRRKIRKTVRDLNKILSRGNKQKNVKEDMKGFVSKSLELADYLFTDHVSNDDLVRKGITVRMTPKEAALVKETENILSQLYDHADSLTDEDFKRLDAQRKRNMEKLRDLLTAQRNERLSTPVYQLFSDLVTEYAKLKNSGQDAVKAAYNPEVERFLRSYIGESEEETDSDRKTLLQNMRVADMTAEELWKLRNAYEMVLHAVKTANALFVEGKTESVTQMAERIREEFSKRKIPDKKAALALQKFFNKLEWSYEKLHYALDRIGSETFTELITKLADSENTVMRDVLEAVIFRDAVVEKYGFNSWKINQKLDREFVDNTGKTFKLTLGELMALYAYSRRTGAWDHIEYGGFVFGKTALTDPRPADSYKLTKEQCEAITGLLTPEQKGYVEEMQKFLSDVMGAKGNEVSMMLYGIEMFTEKNYFPLHVAGQFKVQAQEAQAKAAAGFGSMTNAGFTHAQNPNAKAPFVLEAFHEVWADHVNEMSRYHGTVPALEDIRRVMNRTAYFESTADSVSLKQLMENVYGKEAVEYFDDLYREANSGAIRDKLEKKSHKLLSLFRKNSVAYSLSVLIQQPASVVRAYAMIDRKYFGFHGVGTISLGVAKLLGNKWTKAHTRAYNEMLKYAPGVTMAKEIGGFDTHTGGSIRSHLLDTGKGFFRKMKTEKASGKAGAVMELVDNNPIANLPNLADKIAWIEIWNACKREVMTKRGQEFFADGGVQYAKEKKKLEKEEVVRYSERESGEANPQADIREKYGLTDSELHSLTRYKSSESYKINALLREGVRMEELSKDDQEFVENLDSALAKLPVYKGTVYRNLTFDDFGGKEAFDSFIAAHSQNNIATFDAYTSASTRADGYPVTGEYVAHLIIPESANAHDMSDIGNNFESEVLYERESEFVVEKVTFDSNGTPTIYLKEDVYNAEGEHGQLHSQKRSKTMQSVRSENQRDSNVSGVSQADTSRSVSRGLSQIQIGAEVSTEEDAFLTAVGQRFTEVIRGTQVYDSMFSKSPMLKSKNLAVQYLVSFMNEPNTVANMVEKAVRDVKNGNVKNGIKTAAVVIHSVIFTNVLKSIIYAMRDDDEDETYTEKYLEAFAGNLVNDFMPLNYIPVARDVWSIAQGYEVERADMAIIADALDALDRVIRNACADTDEMTEEQLIEFDQKVIEANWRLVESVAAFFGIPVKNVRREVRGVLDHARIAYSNAGKTTGLSAWDKICDGVVETIPFMKASTKSDKLYGAIAEGDQEYLERLKAAYKTETAYKSAVIKALRENDPRIHAAAKAGIDGNSGERNRIFREIKAEGKVASDLIIDAINAETSTIRNKEKPEKVTGQYEPYDFVTAVSAGDTETANTVWEDILSTYVANGKTQAEAETAFASDVKSSIKEAYSYGEIDRQTAEEILITYTGMDEDTAADKVDCWDYCSAGSSFSKAFRNPSRKPIGSVHT